MFQFDGRTAVVTGAASGIGAALAEALAERGCHLALADLDEAGLQIAADRLARPGRTLTTIRLDVADDAEVAAFAAAVERDHGGAQLLINNAGIALLGDFEEIEAADFDRLIAVNLMGVVRVTRSFLPLLRKADAAHIVNLSSLFGLIAPPGQTAYAASKFAVRGFSDALRHELAGTPVRVTTIHPGGIATNIARNARVAGAATAEEAESRKVRAERVLRMPAHKAAEQILRAVARGKPRAIIGLDAQLAAIVERLAPASYGLLFGWRGRAKDAAERDGQSTESGSSAKPRNP
jgi:short-subunit dehydrogenase